MQMPDSSKPTKAKLIHQAIADDIVHGRVTPGTILDETSIAARFGVSRTPIREAIRQLEAIGLVRAPAQRGAVVVALTDRQLDEMFAVMAELESLCARWAAIAMTAEERRQLVTLQKESERIVSGGDRDAYSEFNNRFHEAIYRGAHNAFLAELTLTVRRRCAPFRRAQFETLGRLAKSHAEHDAVVTAIQRGDAEAAAAGMRLHMVVVRNAVEEVTGEAARRADWNGEVSEDEAFGADPTPVA